MINIDSLSEKFKGQWVVYDKEGINKAVGKIKSWNDKFIFVVYKCDYRWDYYQNYTGCATRPEDLELLNLKKEETMAKQKTPGVYETIYGNAAEYNPDEYGEDNAFDLDSREIIPIELVEFDKFIRFMED